MKKILFALLLFSATATAQDNENTKVTVSIQARDCEFIGLYVANDPEFEELYDAMKAKFRIASPPSGTTAVAIDTIPIGQWLSISAKLRTAPYAIMGSVWARYDAALRASNNVYMTGRLNVMDAGDTEIFTNFRIAGRAKLRRQ